MKRILAPISLSMLIVCSTIKADGNDAKIAELEKRIIALEKACTVILEKKSHQNTHYACRYKNKDMLFKFRHAFDGVKEEFIGRGISEEEANKKAFNACLSQSDDTKQCQKVICWEEFK